MKMAESPGGVGSRKFHFNNLVQFLNPKSKNIEVERIDLELALQGFLEKFMPHLSIEQLNEDPISTFSYAGHVIQSSVNVYGRKIDVLYNEVRSLMDDLTVQKQRAEEKKRQKEANGDADTANNVGFDDDWQDWYANDAVPMGKHIQLTEEDESHMEPIDYIVDPPSCMIDLHSDPATRLPIWHLTGKILGYKQDFALGTFTFSSSGELSLVLNYEIPKDTIVEEPSGYLDGSMAEVNVDKEKPAEEGDNIADAPADEPDFMDDNDLHAPPSDNEDGDKVVDLKRGRQEQRQRLKERVQRAIEPHDPYEVIELRDETKAEKKIHEPITTNKRSRKPEPSTDAREFLTKDALGKGPRKPDDTLKNEADKEHVGRRKNVSARARKNKDNVEKVEVEEGSASESEEEEEKPFDPVNFSFDEVQVHADDPIDEFEDNPDVLAAEQLAASRNAAIQQLNMEENKKTFEAWSKKMDRVLKEERELPEHNMAETMKEILANMEKKTDAVPFKEVSIMRSRWDASRVFLATLMLTNNGNLDIIEKERKELPPKYKASDLPVDKMRIKFITKENTTQLIREDTATVSDRRAPRRPTTEVESSSSDENSGTEEESDTSGKAFRRRRKSSGSLEAVEDSPQPHCSTTSRRRGKRPKK